MKQRTLSEYFEGNEKYMENDFNKIVGKEFDIDKHVRLEVGLATGYSGGDIVPFMRYTDRGWFIAPAYEFDRNNIGLTLGYEWKLK